MSHSHRVLLIDNYDSFTYNLVQALRVLGAEVLVYQHDELGPEAALALSPTHLVVSPGPGRPEEAGASSSILRALLPTVPVLGVCLGHQVLVAGLGGRLVGARRLVHGKSSAVHHDGRGVYRGLPNPLQAGRYHSRAVAPDALPPDLAIVARTADGEVMGVRHRRLPVEGVQFHPESVLTPEGDRLLGNFLALRRAAADPIACRGARAAGPTGGRSG